MKDLDVAGHNLLNIHCQLSFVDVAALRLDLLHAHMAVVIHEPLLLLNASLVFLDTDVQEAQKERHRVSRIPSSLVMRSLANTSLILIFPSDGSGRLSSTLLAVDNLHAGTQHVTLMVPPLAYDHFP